MARSEVNDAPTPWSLSHGWYRFCLCFPCRGKWRPPTARFAREAHGEMIGGNDLWIAAHAKSAGVILVTNNEREFKRIPGLKVQNWVRRRP